MWFDFANLILMSLYFFKFGNQSKVLQSKVSFSKTSRLEKLLREYTRYQREHKEALVGKLTADASQGEKTKEEVKVMSKHLIDEREEFLGPTYYLTKLKKKIFIYNFTKRMKQFTFIGVQIMTAILVFILAVLQRSLMSFGYMLMCLVLFYNLKTFFYQEQLKNGEQWINRYIIRRPLLFYCFLDVALQVCYQIPLFPNSVSADSSSEPARYLGFDKIFYEKDVVTGLGSLLPPTDPAHSQKYVGYLEMQNLYYFIVKALNLFFIFLQGRIYESEGFSKFIRTDLR
jgi:hypothetical protein